MPLREVYSHPVQQTYRASVCSKAFFFQVISLALTIICPLLVAYRSQGFWLKTRTYQEQPTVRFKHHFLFLLETEQVGQYMLWSSFPGLNNLEAPRLRLPIIKTSEADVNSDGKADSLHLNARFPLVEGESIRCVKTLLVFDYSLDLYSRFRMETLAYVDQQSVQPGSQLKVEADLRLSQRVPLWYRGVDIRWNRAVVNSTSHRAESFLLHNILHQNFLRNVSTRLDPLLVHWQPSPPYVRSFEVDVNVRYVTETIEYYAGFWELIKWAWVQYLSILLVFIFVFARIRAFAFQNRILPAVPQRIHGFFTENRTATTG